MVSTVILTTDIVQYYGEVDNLMTGGKNLSWSKRQNSSLSCKYVQW